MECRVRLELARKEVECRVILELAEEQAQSAHVAGVAMMRKQLEELEEDSGVEAGEGSVYMARMTMMPKVVRELPILELPKERLGMAGGDGGPDTKDMYMAGGSKVQGKTQLHGATTKEEYVAEGRGKQGK